MSNEIIKVVDALAAKLGVAIDWTATNVMPYLQQLMERYIDYEIAMSAFWIISWFAATVVFLVVTCLLYPKAKSLHFDEGFGVCWAFICSAPITVVLTVIFVIVGLVQAVDIITCVTLPEKVIFEYLSTLMNGAV